jgi:Fe-S-cluster-containing dehydrogenase component
MEPESHAPPRTPQYGFVIDQRKCIGCHACTVACKAENEVPLGKFRTWVKYVDKGTFPAVRRHFTVLRCNHCDAAPCVEICPVNALHKRKDAIVDLDKDVCIGCRACMQACPYDAIYLNDDTGTAEKCHYCAHRTELGLEPACVVVCPERAIVAGDMSNPASGISQLIATMPTSRRKLEKGTKPRVHYIDALPEALTPGAATEPSAWLWSNRQVQPPPVPENLRPPEDIVTTLNVDHPPVWGWHIWTYLVTKNIAAGAGIVAPFLAMLGVAEGQVRDFVPELVALVFLGVTTFLLIHDLGRPERFWRLLFAPNTKSWLVKGGWFLSAFGAVTTASLVARWFEANDVADALRWANVPLAVMTSGYSAFLFAQCKGRDLWLERGLFATLVAGAANLGATAALDLAPETGSDRGFALALFMLSAVGLLTHLRHSKGPFWILLGGAVFGARQALKLDWWAVDLVATAAVVYGHFIRERSWVRRGQAPLIS